MQEGLIRIHSATFFLFRGFPHQLCVIDFIAISLLVVSCPQSLRVRRHTSLTHYYYVFFPPFFLFFFESYLKTELKPHGNLCSYKYNPSKRRGLGVAMLEGNEGVKCGGLAKAHLGQSLQSPAVTDRKEFQEAGLN